MSGIGSQIQAAEEQAREQLTAAWQLHVARVEEQLRSGWRDDIDRLLHDRFGDLRTAVETELAASRNLTARLNELGRRLRQSENEDEWTQALLDGAREFCPKVAVFRIQGEELRVDGSGGIRLEVPFSQAPAIASAVETLDPVVAAAVASEVSQPVLDALDGRAGSRSHIFPVISRKKAVAVLYAEGDSEKVDRDALELLATLAGTVWETRAAAASPETAGLVSIQSLQSAPAPDPVSAPAWSDLPAEEQDRHLRAQRYARVHVAEIRLYKSHAVKLGRAGRSLYNVLREDIDRGRDGFAREFIENCPSMVDYFHVELVRTLANDNATLLGPDYPGPLI